MENFNLIDNHTILAIDKISREPQRELPIKNTLKTQVKSWNKYSLNSDASSGVYNQTFNIEIPREYNNLAQLYVKCTLSTNGVSTTVESYLGTKIFRSIRIKTKNGTTLQKFTPMYLQSRIDQLWLSPIYSYLQVSMMPDIAFSAGSPTVFVPLFCFFSESELSFLQTRHLEQLEVEFITNRNKGAMGLSNDLTSLDTELYCLYHDDKEMPMIQRNLISSYNIFEENTTVVPSGSTSAKILLRCPHPAFSLNFCLVDSTSNIAEIKTLKLSFADRTFLELDYRINYQNYGTPRAYLEAGIFTYFFNKYKERSYDSGLIQFNGALAPVYAEITFDSLSANHTLYIFEEYRTIFNIDDKGIIQLSTDIQGWDEQMKQSNSDKGRASLGTVL